MNLVDFLAILPYFISAVIDSLQDLHILSKAGKVGTENSKNSILNPYPHLVLLSMRVTALQIDRPFL